MDTTNLVYFIALSRYNNLTKVAENYHISHSALSRRMSALEEDLGVALFDRSMGKFDLTEAGREFLTHANRMIKQENSLMKRMEIYRNENAISVGFSHTSYLRGFVDVMRTIADQDPECQFVFRENSYQKNSAAFQNRELDLLYTTRGEVEDFPGVVIHTVARNELALYVPKSHPLWNKVSITARDLEGETICVVQDVLTGVKTIKTLLQDEGNIQIEEIDCASGDEALMHCVISGYLGLTAMIGSSERMVFQDLMSVRRIEHLNLSLGDQVLAYWRDNARVKKLMQIFEDTN